MESLKKCMHCTACEKICPKKAIKLINNDIGMNAKIIDENKCNNCNLCNKICPLNCNYERNNHVKLIAGFCNNESDRKKASSGGLFYCIASEVIKERGAVYGACFDDGFNVIHQRVTTLNNLKKMRGSKYVQSNLGNSYINVKKDLSEDLYVLFSGTPCQIAGLKKFLGKDYNKLLTVDIVCHGVPSADIWNKYIVELEKKHKSKVINVEFRNKKQGWQNPQMVIKFENNEKISSNVYDNPFGQAFLKNMILQETCYDCNFNCFRNQSDITLGDFWNYKAAFLTGDFSKGLSLIFLNTDKGLEMFEKTRSNLQTFENINMKNAILGNYPIIHPPIPHYNRGKALNDLANKKNVSEVLSKWLDERQGLSKDEKGVAILNFSFENYNYGANLVAYSLSETIKKLGYNPYVIDYEIYNKLNPIERFKTYSFFQFRSKYLNLTPTMTSSEKAKILNNYFDNFIVGSDQVWRKLIVRNHLYTYFLDFVKSSKNIIAYAASFGTDKFEGDENEINSCQFLLNKFNAISVREKDGVDICENTFDVKPELTLDPTLLLTSDDYCKLIEDDSKEESYIALYFIQDHENQMINNPELARLFPNKKVKNIKGAFTEMPYGKEFIYNDFSNWIKGIKNSDFVITDSYHGVIFSIIFKKQFICLGRKSTSLSRFNSLFDMLKGNTEKRNYRELEEIDNVRKLPKLNYTEIYQNLENKRYQSVKFLKRSLKNKNDNNVKYINALELERERLMFELQMEREKSSAEVKMLNKSLNDMHNELDMIFKSKSWTITKPLRKVVSLVKNNK